MKMEATDLTEKLENVYQATQHHIPKFTLKMEEADTTEAFVLFYRI
jgi:hypothetical protein